MQETITMMNKDKAEELVKCLFKKIEFCYDNGGLYQRKSSYQPNTEVIDMSECLSAFKECGIEIQ